MERSSLLADNYICKAVENNQLINNEINICNIAPEIDDGGLCKGGPRMTIFGQLSKNET